MVRFSLQLLAGSEPAWLLIVLAAAAILGLLFLIVRTLPRIVSWGQASLRSALGGSAATTEAAYRAALIARLQKHHLAGSESSLDAIFVAPRLLAPQSGLTDDELLDSGSSVLHYLWPELAAGIATVPPPSATFSELLAYSRRSVITGEAGSGKTTLLAMSAILCARGEADERYAVPQGMLPVFFHLGTLETLAAEQRASNVWSPDPILLLVEVLKRDGLDWKGLDQLLLGAARAGRLFLMIDGWDDLPGNGLGQTGIWLRDFLQAYSETRVLLAGPLRGYGPLMRLGFVVSGPLRWRRGQAELLGRKWAQSAGASEVPATSKYWRPEFSPLITTLLLRRQIGDPASPSQPAAIRQVDLLGDYIEDLIPPRGTGEAPDSEVTELELWSAVAFKMVEDGAWEMAEEALDELLESNWANMGSGVTDIDQAKIGRSKLKKRMAEIRRSLEASELFVTNQARAVRFQSPVFRDYLAARHVMQRSRQATLVAQMSQRNWAPVVRFYMALEGPESIQSLLDASGRKLDDAYQAASWMAELAAEEQWRQNVLIRLGRSCMDAQRPPAARQRAVAALAITGDPGVGALMGQVIRQYEPSMRQVALAAMARVSPVETVGAARRLFADSDACVRIAAVHAIAWIAEPEADKVLDETLLLPDPILSQAAAEGLALNGREEDYRSLRRAATTQSFKARRSALAGLNLVDEPWARTFLDKLADGDGAPLAEAEARGGARKWHRSRAGDQPWLVAWAVARGRVVPVGQAAIPLLLEALQDSEAAIRQQAAATLGQLATIDGTALLKRALQDVSPDVRQSAFVALAKIARAWTPGD